MNIFFNRKLLIITLAFIGATCLHAQDLSRMDADKLIPRKHLITAVDFFKKNRKRIKNQRYLVIIDYKAHNSKERFYLLDLESGAVETYLAAHGRNSDPDYDGYATEFSNTLESRQTSLGFFTTDETYYGGNGYSLRLNGLSSSNSNARVRSIVIHGANYVNPGKKIGRSYGCPALEMRYHQDVIDRIKGGTLIYAAY